MLFGWVDGLVYVLVDMARDHVVDGCLEYVCNDPENGYEYLNQILRFTIC